MVILTWLLGIASVLGIGGTVAALVFFPTVALPILEKVTATLLSCKPCLVALAFVLSTVGAYWYGHHGEYTKGYDKALSDIAAEDNAAIQRATENVQSRLSDGLAFLATVGSTAPFVGLFGTVWGIYNALVKIGVSGQASIDKVAGPVGESLIMTAIGLAVAVPAVLGYNWLVRRNKATLDRVRAFGSDIHAVLLANTPR